MHRVMDDIISTLISESDIGFFSALKKKFQNDVLTEKNSVQQQCINKKMKTSLSSHITSQIDLVSLLVLS